MTIKKRNPKPVFEIPIMDENDFEQFWLYY